MKLDQISVNFTPSQESFRTFTPSQESLRTRDLLPAEGPPLTTRELARLTGMSPSFIRKEIRANEVQAVVMGRGRKRVFRILRGEARRYMRQLGVI